MWWDGVGWGWDGEGREGEERVAFFVVGIFVCFCIIIILQFYFSLRYSSMPLSQAEVHKQGSHVTAVASGFASEMDPLCGAPLRAPILTVG